MKTVSLPSRPTIAGLALLIMGGLCLAAESVFYGDLDAQGVLQESFFLPLSFILMVSGLVVLLFSGSRFLIRKFR